MQIGGDWGDWVNVDVFANIVIHFMSRSMLWLEACSGRADETGERRSTSNRWQMALSIHLMLPRGIPWISNDVKMNASKRVYRRTCPLLKAFSVR